MHRIWERLARLVPLDEQLVSLGLAREVEVPDRPVGIGNRALEQMLEVLDHALGRRPLVEIGRILEGPGDGVADLGQRHA